MVDLTAVSVSQLTAIVRGALSAAPELEDILVEGEISNLSTPVSGHIYFTLKDATSSVRCVVFRTQAQRIAFRLENGMKVFVHGRVDVYDQQGQYQLYGDNVDPSGVGALAFAIEQTRRRLAAEGMFDEQRKRPLPRFPRRVVVVTSRTGAAWRDVSTVLRRRAPWVEIILSPASVQGGVAVDAVSSALLRAGQVRDADIILLVRGGGAVEDLAAFSDEKVVRAVVNCPVPVIAGVGHDTDICLAEMAADKRAPTPSAAAELAVPAVADVRRAIASRNQSLWHVWRSSHARRREGLVLSRRQLDVVSPQRQLLARREGLGGRLAALRFLSPMERVKSERPRVVRRLQSLGVALQKGEQAKRRHLETVVKHLDALSPRRVLQRGFSITLSSDGATVRSSREVASGSVLRTIVASGEIESVVSATREAPTGAEQMYDGAHGGEGG
jgi:exodeoxyribonuclease VII large subunit